MVKNENWESEIFYINEEKNKITWHYACFKKKKKLMSFHDKIFLFMKKVEIVYVMI